MSSNATAAVTGGAGLTAPLWLQYVDPVLQSLIAILGLVVLILTVWNKWLDLKVKRATLREAGETEDDVKEATDAHAPADR